ncbi:hypothetical protein D6D12_08278 [Aureobasidium pullulans]|uniref:RTA1 domain protein n=1 Tax=Aureobasidium pullulans TaxID=5580 RepID=A0AB74JJ52_AURPU|nr:hypothetical protein D6D12_08278 [Aureobasidium pullulans]THX52344.1 hypothetical protein D6D11_04774 [Aureobasidium pullulans]
MTLLYAYQPNHVAPIILALIVVSSLLLHAYQNFKYKYWKITFFMVWGGLVFATGWITRCASTYSQQSMSLYIIQYVFTVAGPPIYSAAEYNILGRLLRYVPMHSPLHPDRVLYVFIYLGTLVESLTGAGASMFATVRPDDRGGYKTGGILLAISLLLQAMVEFVFVSLVIIVHRRCLQSGTLPRKVHRLCIMLYGTSTLVFLRCLFRAIEAFAILSVFGNGECHGLCHTVVFHEWYLYVFEALPMILYTLWINLMHPGTMLPSDKNRYLDVDGKTERIGPGWIDKRSRWETFADPLDLTGAIRGHPSHEKFWLEPQRWPLAQGTEAPIQTFNDHPPKA